MDENEVDDLQHPLIEAELRTQKGQSAQALMPQATWIDQQDEAFEKLHMKRIDPLPVPKRQWLHKQVIRYRVYSSAAESVVVEANSASRAIAASGIADPFKVERYQPEYDLRLHEEEATPADLHVDREVLDMLTDETPVLSHQIMRGLEEAGEELEEAEVQAAETAAENDENDIKLHSNP
jgi:hypothetical protein